MLSFVW